ncbi:hypothetical protein X949_4913 [Burkholderia pseudomallei MSHR5609]|nr:hypothetical protein X949_4913 [Burkholderia pseudomallei MSHR5609]
MSARSICASRRSESAPYTSCTEPGLIVFSRISWPLAGAPLARRFKDNWPLARKLTAKEPARAAAAMARRCSGLTNVWAIRASTGVSSRLVSARAWLITAGAFVVERIDGRADMHWARSALSEVSPASGPAPRSDWATGGAAFAASSGAAEFGGNAPAVKPLLRFALIFRFSLAGHL